MKNEIRPIDKSKPSNHRCVNCEEWGKATDFQGKHWRDPVKYCEKAGKGINYWNRCPLFRWNPHKTYKENNNDD